MKKRLSVQLAALGVLASMFVAGCATTVDPCSTAGIERRVSASLSGFSRAYRADLNEVKRAVAYFDGETVLGTMRIAQAINSLRRVATGFEEDIVPELQSISQQCGTVGNLREIFVDFLRDEGFNNRVLEWVDDFQFAFES